MSQLRIEIVSRILQGFCANPAIFAANSQYGWGLVNSTDAQLVDYAYRLADEALCTERPIRPTAGSAA